MEWFYLTDGGQVGPVSDSELKTLFKEKKIDGATKVRGEGMADWVELSHFFKGKNGERTAPDNNPPAGAAQRSSPAAVEARCTECNLLYPEDDLVRFGNASICAACKPVYTQKLREGVADSGAFSYAGFWIRTGAKIIDWIIMGTATWVLLIPFQPDMTDPESLASFWGPWFFITQLINIGIPAAYNTFFIGKLAATPGKMACGLRVVLPDGEPVSYLRALGRHFSEFISSLILCIGYLMVAFDKDERRALHDRICNTRVVRK